LKTENNLKQMY